MPTYILRSAAVKSLLLLTVMLTNLGCGSSQPKLDLVPTGGIVTLDGVPLEGATVRFFGLGPKNLGVSGETDGDGKYQLGLSTYTGAMPGNYKVVIEYLTDLQGKPIELQDGMDAQMLMMEGKAKQSLHPNYSDFENTTLKAEVKAGDSKSLDFNLKSDGT